jgi:hypothetical protein
LESSEGAIRDLQYSDIELDESELEEALRAAREAKHYRLVREAYSRSLREDPVYPKFTAEQVFEKYGAILNDEGIPFGNCMSDKFEARVKWLCLYFTGDPRFELNGGSLNKGLLLSGGVGIGKSTLMKFFQRNQVASFKVIACQDVEAEFAINGDEAMDEYAENRKIAVNSDAFGHQSIGYCFDDLGAEDASKHYGRVKNVMQTVILKRYDLDLPYWTTHITTNLSADQLMERYDNRAMDRMRAMFNIIDFPITEKSRRK